MRALAILSAVTGDSLTSHLGKILPAMLNAIQDCFGTEHEKEVSEHMAPCMLRINYFEIFLVAESSPYEALFVITTRFDCASIFVSSLFLILNFRAT